MKNWSFLFGMVALIIGFGADSVLFVGVGVMLTINTFFPVLVNPIKRADS